jgi:large subunit ribosomal protein L35
MKTNKSYAKRLKLTKQGKIVARKPGQNHFNAKASSSKRTEKRKSVSVSMSNKDKSRFLANM